MARIEAGFIITNMDFIPAEQAVREDRARSPFEMGLDWMIDWDKGHFTGRRALLAEKKQGHLEMGACRARYRGQCPGRGSLIYHNKKHEVGYITAAAWSPTLSATSRWPQVRADHARRAKATSGSRSMPARIAICQADGEGPRHRTALPQSGAAPGRASLELLTRWHRATGQRSRKHETHSIH